MENLNIFQDIAERTGGDIYLGVVGPVRTGKSTFIKRLMELLVLPNIADPNDKERAVDELPQSGAGRMIMTVEPKFIPQDAVEIAIRDGLKMKVRMVDCVGYTVDGALGYEEEEGGPRMVRTPWFDEAIPFQEAAELGTRKVIADHSTLGIVVTTDGSVADIPRDSYSEAEERVIEELKELGKPYIIVLNTLYPDAYESIELVQSLEEKYDVPVLAINCAETTDDDLLNILQEALYEFPVQEINVKLPLWVEELESAHWLRSDLEQVINEAVTSVNRLRDIDHTIEKIRENEFVAAALLQEMNLGTGVADIKVQAQDGLFFKVLEEVSGLPVSGEHDILRLMRDLSKSQAELEKIAPALEEVQELGYGVVTPSLDEMILEEPELIRQGNRFGVKLKASAPSMHIIRADISTEITPIIGTEKQCEDLVRYMLEEFEDDPAKIWQKDIFGKSLHDLVREGIQNKLHRMPDNAQEKLQETVQRIVNEGSGGLICIII
ncbi:MAG: stage IV sporulation protein A [Syntrophaceticus sp.]|jgi:stage IV sporulation protein A|nr:stage IV sporulation protein A [Syntrophaceticus sp.]MDD3314427.1 stage IV sporulation protein A [Syntrophaceticus sp.]MDD4359672.1 stage IV sporulation protein A [Syntrophaceticus sp.]MDD4782935.1 stage IV sporulation protein A [Syntrophaceticus sp.]HBG22041.1 stage IV sporulation protein A [Peptococcaceae bacterium]